MDLVVWNARGIRGKIPELNNLINEIDILCVTESKLKEEDKLHMQGYNIERTNRRNNSNIGAGGTAIIIKKSITYQRLQLINTPKLCEVTAVRINNIKHKETLTIIVLYRQPGHQMIKKEWSQFMDQFKKVRNLIITGDFNAHNTAWNCRNTDNNGTILADAVWEADLYVINTNTKSYMGSHDKSRSNLDLVIVSTNLIDKTDHQQVSDTWSSDHHPISVKINMITEYYRKKTNRITKKYMNWKKYKEVLLTWYNEKMKDWEKKDTQQVYNLLIEGLKYGVENKKGKRIKQKY